MKKATLLLLKRLTYRHQSKKTVLGCLRSGVKAMVALTFLALVGYFSDQPLLIAPFGASCILIFTSPEDVFSQPINIIGGYAVAILVSAVLAWFLPYAWWNIGLMVGLTISAMAYLRVTHPPCGAVPLLIHMDTGLLAYHEVLITILGSVLLVAVSIILHRIPPRRTYPRTLPK